jgi:hypothetical protein
MLWKIKTIAFVAAASATLSVATAAPVIDVRVAPPPPRYEFVPADRPGYIWVPGYWDWHGHHHVWVKGHWQHARHGYAYRSPAWVQDGDRWVLHRGEWTHDRDHDGVPDAADHHPDNPRRP